MQVEKAYPFHLITDRPGGFAGDCFIFGAQSSTSIQRGRLRRSISDMHRIRYDHTYICIVRRPDLTIACRFRRWANRQKQAPGAAVSHYGSKQHRCRPAALQNNFLDGPVTGAPALLAALRFRPSDFADFWGWYRGRPVCSSHAMSKGARCL